jgi:hypothetical protein
MISVRIKFTNPKTLNVKLRESIDSQSSITIDLFHLFDASLKCRTNFVLV